MLPLEGIVITQVIAKESHLPNTVLWALGTVAINRSIQSKCYEAITRRETLGGQNDPDKDKDDYLMAFVKEVNRFFTTLRLSLARETTNDTVWRGHWIGEGTPVLCNIHAMNRGPRADSAGNVLSTRSVLPTAPPSSQSHQKKSPAPRCNLWYSSRGKHAPNFDWAFQYAVF